MVAFIINKVYIVDNLKISLLINMNILKVKKLILNCNNNLISLKSHCEFIIKMITISTYDITIYYSCYTIKLIYKSLKAT